jgi:hypothetical protein
MNRLHAMAKVQRAVFESDTIEPKDIYLKLRFEIPETLMGRKEIEAFAEHSIQLRSDARFPVEKARMALDILEAELRADVLDALGALDVTNPRDCREVYELHRQLGSSIGEHSLRHGIDALEAAGKDFEALRARLDEIYPPAKSEDE